MGAFQGKTIENYLSVSLLKKICKKRGSTDSQQDINRDKYSDFEEYCPAFDSKRKVNFAKKAVEHMKQEEIDNNLDLEEKINEICDMIRAWRK